MMKEPGVAIFCLDRIVDLFFIIDIMLNFMLSYRSSVTGGVVLPAIHLAKAPKGTTE